MNSHYIIDAWLRSHYMDATSQPPIIPAHVSGIDRFIQCAVDATEQVGSLHVLRDNYAMVFTPQWNQVQEAEVALVDYVKKARRAQDPVPGRGGQRRLRRSTLSTAMQVPLEEHKPKARDKEEEDTWEVGSEGSETDAEWSGQEDGSAGDTDSDAEAAESDGEGSMDSEPEEDEDNSAAMHAVARNRFDGTVVKFDETEEQKIETELRATNAVFRDARAGTTWGKMLAEAVKLKMQEKEGSGRRGARR